MAGIVLDPGGIPGNISLWLLKHQKIDFFLSFKNVLPQILFIYYRSCVISLMVLPFHNTSHLECYLHQQGFSNTLGLLLNKSIEGEKALLRSYKESEKRWDRMHNPNK